MKNAKNISPFTVIVTAICLSLIGFAFLPYLPLKLQPSEKMPVISVYFSMNGATSKVVESEVTSRLEAMFARMSGVEDIESSSQNGSGRITLRLDKHTDIDAARFEVSTLIRQVWSDLPQGVSYPSIYTQSAADDSQGPFLSYTVNALLPPSEILQTAENVFQTGFAEIGEITKVEITGAERKIRRLEYDSELLQRLGISEMDIQSAISNYRSHKNIGKYTLSTNVADTVFNLDDIYLPLPDSSLVCLNRLVKMTITDAPPTYVRRINGLNSIYLSLYASESANQIELQKKAVAKIAELKRKLPHGYELNLAYDATERIRGELDKIYFRSSLTVLILLVFIWLTTFSWRHVLLVTCSLVCNLAVACLVYYLLGVELQLYSLAGITISLNLIIDNTIIMADHWRREHNLAAILPIVAATLTTVGALSVVFFLDDKVKLSLYDFSVVIIVNLIVSVFVALWLVPAILSLQKQKSVLKFYKVKLLVAVYLNRVYRKIVYFLVRFKKTAIGIMILAFGIPFFLMPKEINNESFWAKIYNNVFGSKIYNENIRPYTDVIFGGTLRLFAEKVMDGNYWNSDNEVVLQVYATLPYGTTFQQMDVLIRKMESFLSTYKEIKQFESSVQAMQGHISIRFNKDVEHGAFPYTLKSNIISKGLQLGGGSWSVYGLQDQGFSNSVRETTGSYRLDMAGYNYETLLQWADSVKNHLLSFKRIKEVNINAEQQYYKNDYQEFHLVPRKDVMARQGISAEYLFWLLRQTFVNDQRCATVWNGNVLEDIVMYTRQSEEYNLWWLLNHPVEIGGRHYKISELCEITKQQAADQIVKKNQQYQLCLQYEYIGSSVMGGKVSAEADSIYRLRLPVGYSISYNQSYYWWRPNEAKHYILLALILAVIVFVTAVLFDSLRYPFAIIGIIPVSYIGLFLAFYLFSIKFDIGGFAAMVLLCGITVNASIYIVNEFKKYKRRMKPATAYFKAFNVKIVPIMLTVLSTALGFVPFIVGSEAEGFWFPMAVGTIGGLVMSLVGVVLVLPVMCLKKKDLKTV